MRDFNIKASSILWMFLYVYPPRKCIDLALALQTAQAAIEPIDIPPLGRSHLSETMAGMTMNRTALARVRHHAAMPAMTNIRPLADQSTHPRPLRGKHVRSRPSVLRWPQIGRSLGSLEPRRVKNGKPDVIKQS